MSEQNSNTDATPSEAEGLAGQLACDRLGRIFDRYPDDWEHAAPESIATLRAAIDELTEMALAVLGPPRTTPPQELTNARECVALYVSGLTVVL